ncbi:conserved hypothetical protein [Leishmania major strain Friedlin]|uniref:Uncharacterized protein n=1 Tax=Leishmania major TaxID=5664 RepID=Q4Q2G8_LEIMA|nr:conserved hypothetical protein [Leishmania major strain Friedlin]CAG9582254.1 hypothetical_protein_-_conserved [Leishmania major strain Friedlin]CAJ08097.1 conserved hypothetical protein [Leishmania major strain Friedlin]|eukprot:XP_001686480.1 conserved hypothetical protein [Leishmania major strain Friedlin]
MLRPFQGRAAASTSTATRESTASRVATPQRRHQQMRNGELIDKGSVSTEAEVGKPYWGTTESVAMTRSTTASNTVFSTRAATSTSRTVSGGAAETTSAVSTRSSYLVHSSCPVGEETQELGSGSYSADEVDPLLQAAMQLGSPLYDPVKRQFVCWQLHALEKRPRAAYGDVEGVSCDFCGHTDWLEGVPERATSSPSASATVANADEGKMDTHAPSAAASFTAHARFFYNCSACQVDVCQACLEEVRSDERLHVPCFQCQRCGGYETRQNAPLHRCAEVTRISDDEGSTGVQALLTSPRSNVDASQALPAAPATSSPKYRGVPVGRPVRLGLCRRFQQAVEAVAAPDTEIAAHAGKIANSTPHRKRKRASPEAALVPKQRSGKTTNDTAEVFRVSDVSDKSCRKVRRASASALPKPAPPKQEADDADGDASRALVEAALLPFARYEVHLTPRTAEEVGEVGRIAREQHLVCSPLPSLAKTCVFYFTTRLAAETCVDRATAASLDAILKQSVTPVCRT